MTISSLKISVFLHLGIFAIIIILYYLFKFPITKPVQNISFEVITPKLIAPTLDLKPKVQEKLKPILPEKKAVFGLSRKAILADSTAENSAEIKQGNTVAKEQDNLQLEKNDEDQLPIPSDEYMITQLPKLKSEIRIPYPLEAKKAGIEGAVVMDLLIDSSGKVRKVDLIRGVGYGLNEAAIEALMKFEFTPAKIQNQNVAVKIRYTYRFKLEGA